MLFNSFEFLLFLPIIFILYWFVFNKKLLHQNILILASSYIFYGWWNYKFLSLILLSTIIDYTIGLSISKQNDERKRKLLLWCSILFNLGILGLLKYYNFFIDSWIDLFSSIGYEIKSVWTLNIILPVGISFYTFQTMSYTIDIYRKNLEPTKNFIAFASFVSFFPQLVAGPIERATNLIPQVLKKREFKYEQGVQGLRLILWGMFKKVVIADSLAPLADTIFDNYHNLDGGTLWLGAIYFAFQIYCDFSGYSDIAIGTSKLFGIELMSNFKFPYFSRNIGEFWRRWHVSLSTWFRDYLYITLGGSREGKLKSLRNIFIIFIVSGLWHGANWTFIVWGLMHALLYALSFIFNTNKKYVDLIVAENSRLPSILEFFQMGITFFFVTIGWVFFRSESISAAVLYINKLFFEISLPSQTRIGIIYIILILIWDWIFRKDERRVFNFSSTIIRNVNYLIITLLIVLFFFREEEQAFIYFQF